MFSHGVFIHNAFLIKFGDDIDYIVDCDASLMSLGSTLSFRKRLPGESLEDVRQHLIKQGKGKLSTNLKVRSDLEKFENISNQTLPIPASSSAVSNNESTMPPKEVKGEKFANDLKSAFDRPGVERIVAYYSKSFNKCEQNHCTTRREAQACAASILHYRQYLEGNHFFLRTDSSSLLFLLSLRNPSPLIMRIVMKLSPFHFTAVHRSGVLHVPPDALSRLPAAPADDLSSCDIENCKFCSKCLLMNRAYKVQDETGISAKMLLKQRPDNDHDQVEDTPHETVRVITRAQSKKGGGTITPQQLGESSIDANTKEESKRASCRLLENMKE